MPALVFPSVGSTASLSTLDAEVDGHGAASYDLEAGIRSADLTLTAGKGAWRSNGQVQAFNSAQAVAAYNPASGALELTALKLDAQYTQLDLTGRFKLTRPKTSATIAAPSSTSRSTGPRSSRPSPTTRRRSSSATFRWSAAIRPTRA